MRQALRCPACHHEAMGFMRKVNLVGGGSSCCSVCSAPLSVNRLVVIVTTLVAMALSQVVGVGVLFVLPFSIWLFGILYFVGAFAGYLIPLLIVAPFARLKVCASNDS